MRFAITAWDMYQDIFAALLKRGWEPVKLFTWDAENKSVMEMARKCRIPIQLSPMTESDLQDLESRKCDILIGAGYNWRIGDWRPYMPYAINFHPSPLPEGRGPYPIIRAIYEGRTEWGVSCHKFDMDFDTGDVLAKKCFPLSPGECHESLSLKVQMASCRLAFHVADNFKALWDKATPQGPGSYWKHLSEEERTIDFSRKVEDILRQVAAFGVLETYAPIFGSRKFIRRVVGWKDAHTVKPGTIVHINDRRMVIAVADGYLGLIEWSDVSQSAFKQLGR